MNARRDKLLKRIKVAGSRGLEFGALDRPLLRKGDADVRYVDYTSTAKLREAHQKTPSVNTEALVEVDYVWSEEPLRETVRNELFDFAIASHVIEHVPDLVTWFRELAEVLKPGGVVSLIVPDKRFTFDRLRRTTDVDQVVDAYLTRRRKPSMQQVFDHFGRHAAVDAVEAWTPGYDDSRVRRVHNEVDGLTMAREAAKSGAYVDVHCWVFTPESFFQLFGTLMTLDLFPFKVAEFFDTAPNDIDFFVTFERVADELDRDVRLAAQLQSLPRFQSAGHVPTAPEPGVAETTRLLLKQLEASLPPTSREVVRNLRTSGMKVLNRLGAKLRP